MQVPENTKKVEIGYNVMKVNFLCRYIRVLLQPWAVLLRLTMRNCYHKISDAIDGVSHKQVSL